jgi:hypothetical protein
MRDKFTGALIYWGFDGHQGMWLDGAFAGRLLPTSEANWAGLEDLEGSVTLVNSD